MRPKAAQLADMFIFRSTTCILSADHGCTHLTQEFERPKAAHRNKENEEEGGGEARGGGRRGRRRRRRKRRRKKGEEEEEEEEEEVIRGPHKVT